MSKWSDGEEKVAEWLDLAGIPYVRQWRFHPIRRWRFDFALGVNGRYNHPNDPPTIEDAKLAVEVEGGQFTGGHKRGKAADTDYEKFNAATMRWWRVLRFSTGQVERGEAWPVIHEAWHHFDHRRCPRCEP